MIILFVLFATHVLVSAQTICGVEQFQCTDGSCVSADKKCNGALDCSDGSDEDFVVCWSNKCQNRFRCAYGACVSENATCDGVQDCADNSDELLLECRGERSNLQCLLGLLNDRSFPLHVISSVNDCGRSDKLCKNGDMLLDSSQKCNGEKDCEDGSDESLESCATTRCLGIGFICKYGGCIGIGRMCNGVNDCADGSDELEEICHSNNKGLCVLPAFPGNGYYTVVDHTNASPGQTFESVHLNYTCHTGYKLVGESAPYCTRDKWSHPAPTCVSQCWLNKHPSVEYICLPKNSDSQEGAKECGDLVEGGTTVRPKCRQPNYYSSGVLVNMHCDDGVWDQVTVCSPQCGLVSSQGDQLIVGGRAAVHGELPWHAGIYSKTSEPYMQICGGSLVSSNVVISAAHCFWKDVEKLLPASKFAVAVGKLYRPWNNPQDLNVQKSDVRELKIPPRFQGAAANFQEDIAIVILTEQVEFQTYVRPVCVDFDYNFGRRQLVSGAVGKVAGWGLMLEDGKPSPVLQVIGLPFVDIEQCISASPPGFVEYITSDKFCAGYSDVHELDLLLTYFCCERSMEVTKQVLDLHYTLRSVEGFAHFFRERSFDKKVEFSFNTVLYAPLPKPTVLGYRAVYLRLLDPDARNFFFADIAKCFMMVFDLWQYEEGTWPGFVIMIDMNLATMAHIGKLEVMTIKKVIYFVQECMLIKLKEVHFLNAPHFMDKVMMLLKPFLKKSLLDIIYIHPIGSTTLDKYIYRDSFPKEEGGKYQDHNTIREEVIQRVQNNQQFYAEENKKRVNEALRPGGKSTVQDLFGIQGSFKKLDID